MLTRHQGFRDVLFCPMSDRGGVAAIRRVAATLDPGASLTIAGVVHEPGRFDSFLFGAEHVESVLEAEHAICERRLARCVAAAEHAGRDLEITSLVDLGHRALSLVTRAIAARHDLVAVSADDDVDEQTIRRLLRKSPCPVWVIRPTRASKPRVLAAIDPDPEQAQLTDAILEAASVVAGDDGELNVVTVWELYGEATMRSSAFIHVEPEEIERRRAVVRDAYERALREIVARRIDEHRWTAHVIQGSPSEAIAELVHRRHITTLAIGTVARSGLGGLVMGNTAERLIDDVRCSLIAVKPPGFVSPLAP